MFACPKLSDNVHISWFAGTSEFLSLSKDEFNDVLRSRWERECRQRFEFLRACDQFTDWTNKQLQTCAEDSEIREYKNNTVSIHSCIV